ncbi:MAG: cysteine hydrolase [Lachnospiraceae bacterium]|nr:cysteine hydrolase [Lachnospiraceae bacterium]
MERKGKILIVVDMQKDFITGSLENEMAKKIVPDVINKVKEAYEKGERIIFTYDTHFDDYLDTIEGKHLPVPHCIYHTEGWKFIRELSNYASNSIRVKKETFGSPDVAKCIKTLISSGYEVNEIELIGLCTDICVISNAMVVKAFFPDIPITVDARCCAGVTAESHDNAIRAMEACHIDIKNKGTEAWR